MKNSLEQQLDNANRSTKNAVSLSNAYLETLTTQKDEVDVVLTNADGTTTKIKLKSNAKVWAEIERLKASLLNVSGLSKSRQNTLVSIDDDSSFREIFVQTFDRSYTKAKASEVVFDNDIKTKTNSIVESLLSPLTTVEASLANRFLEANEVLVTKFVISQGDFAAFTNGETYSSVFQKLSATTNNYKYKKVEYLIDTEKRSTRFYGEFDVIQQKQNDDSTIDVTVDTLRYSDKLNAVENSRELVVNNKLVSTNGQTRWNVVSVDTTNNIIKIKAEAGYAPLFTGDNQLSILSVETNETRKVRIPVKLKEKSIIFVSPVNKHTNAEAPFSEAKLFDSSTYTVTVGNNTFSFDEYFASKVADIGAYFESIVRESAIPANLGEKPNAPSITASDFNVVQINKHLTNTPDAKKIKALQTDFERNQTEIDVLTKSISNLTAKISNGNYVSQAAKDKDEALRSAKLRQKEEKTAYAGSLTTDIKTKLSNSSASVASAKYRVRGFWPVQPDIESSFTNPQKIVQYEVRYRYVANNKTTTDADQMSYSDGSDGTIDAVFSPWNYIKTEPLKKYKTTTGEFLWSSNDVSSIEQSNINQLDIPIQFGENVELQIRAISEAGYPTAPITSDWSTLTQIRFPENLLQESTLADIARANSEALRQQEIQAQFQNEGITQHISKAIYEKGVYYGHDTKEIASGFRTNEQTIISLFDFLTNQKTEIERLKDIVDRRYAIISTQIVDSSNKIYDVSKFSKIKLFAGYYTDSVSLADESNNGTIVTKTFYLRFNNKNAQTVEMLSISPGTLTTPTTNSLYNTVPVSILGSSADSTQQLNGQIFYVRSTDISGSTNFFIDDSTTSTNTAPASDIDATAAQAAKNVVHLQGSSFELIKLSANAGLENYVAVSTSHPAYVLYTQNNANTQPLLDEFERIRQYNATYKNNNVQNIYNENRAVEYIDDDKYLVGKNSVGARLYAQFNQLTSIQVDGIDTSSALQIHSGDSNAIIVPIVFQYRMTDAIGNVDGDSSKTVNSNFEYKKSMGIDLIVQGETFKFDVEVSAKFRPTSISNNNLGISTTKNIESTTTSPTIN